MFRPLRRARALEQPVGCYLVGIGFITLALSLAAKPALTDAIRFLSGNMGVAVLVVGAMHFSDMGYVERGEIAAPRHRSRSRSTKPLASPGDICR